MKKDKAIFLDRDGIINEDFGYVYKISDFKFTEGIFDTLRYFQNLGYKLFIVTNQSGIGRKYYTIEDFHILNQWMIEELKKEKINISQVEFCPHAPDENCQCRKPKTKMIDNILNNYTIDLENSWFIGDKQSDMECANNGNIKNKILVSKQLQLTISKEIHIVTNIKVDTLKKIIHN